MSADRIAMHVPYLTGRERGYIDEVFARRSFGGNGHFGQRVQAWLRDRTGAAHALLTHSCTGALELACMALGLGEGDEVIMPSFTFVATATAALRAGATPVFCEIDPRTMTIDVADAERRITAKTRAIMPVHYAGIGADMTAVMALAAAHDLVVIEDAAQGVGASRAGRPLGSIGAFGCFSFHETKNVHCGLAGALLINDEARFDRVENMWERGTDRSKFFKGLVDKYSWVDEGSSFYPTELQAAFLLAQLEGLDDNTAARGEVVAAYRAGFADDQRAGRLTMGVVPDDDVVSNHHIFWIRLPTPALADEVRHRTNAAGVQTVIHYVPLHDSKMGARLGYTPTSLPITQQAAGSLLRLPLHTELSAADVARVIATVQEAARAAV